MRTRKSLKVFHFYCSNFIIIFIERSRCLLAFNFAQSFSFTTDLAGVFDFADKIAIYIIPLCTKSIRNAPSTRPLPQCLFQFRRRNWSPITFTQSPHCQQWCGMRKLFRQPKWFSPTTTNAGRVREEGGCIGAYWMTIIRKSTAIFSSERCASKRKFFKHKYHAPWLKHTHRMDWQWNDGAIEGEWVHGWRCLIYLAS